MIQTTRPWKTRAMTRKYHPWWVWECYKAGFYKTTPPEGVTPEEAKTKYRDFLKNLDAFQLGMQKVEKEWPHSCEQFLTNPALNRIAWLGQAAMCIMTEVPSHFRGGFKLLSESEQEAANLKAENFLKEWLYKQKAA